MPEETGVRGAAGSGVGGVAWGSRPLAAADGKEGVRFTGEYGHSDYKSNRNSGYVSQGNLGRLEVASVLDEGNLTLSLQLMRVDPNYNPALFNASLLGIRFVRPYNFLGRFSLYDNGNYPQNRQGLLFKGSYNWNEQHDTLSLKAGFHQQTQTSLYDVHVQGGSSGVAIPTIDVVGFSPGFFDPIFSGFAHPNVYGKRSGNSFDANLNPLENPRGQVQELGLCYKHKFDDPKLTIDFAVERNAYRRDSGLTPAQGGSQNQVDLSDSWTLHTGLELVHAYGHHDPGGLHNGFAGKVIRRVRSLARNDAVKLSPVELASAMSEMMEFMSAEANLRGAQIEVQSDLAEVQVLADRTQLQQVLLNLLMNALEAMQDTAPDRRLIGVSLRPNGPEGMVLMAVEDRGVGIEPERLEEIFEPFQTSKPNGMGIGRSICRSIIEAHGGRLWAENNAPGGATFLFTLPAS